MNLFKTKLFLLAVWCLFALAGCDSCNGGGSADGSSEVNGDGSGGAAQISANDIDGDLLLNDVDNCPETYNADQTDSDNDGKGNACDEDYAGSGKQEEEVVTQASDSGGDPGTGTETSASNLEPHFSKNVVEHFAGAYNWNGYSDGISTQKFLSDNNYKLEDIFKEAGPAKILYDKAIVKPLNERPARISSNSAVAAYGDVLYYAGFPGILYRVKNGVSQKIAFPSGEWGYKDGPGMLAKAGNIRDLIVAPANIGTKITKGDIIAVDVTNGYLRLIKVSETGGSATTMVSNIGPYILGISRVEIYGNNLYAVSSQLDSSTGVYNCGGVYEIDVSKTSPTAKLLIAPEFMSKSCIPYAVDILVNEANIYLLGEDLLGEPPVHISELRFFDRKTGAYQGAYSGSGLNLSRALSWTPAGDIIIDSSFEITKITDPAKGAVTATMIAGNSNVNKQGWQEVNKNWAVNSSKEDYRLKVNSSASLSLDAVNGILYVTDIGNNAIRSIHFVKDEEGKFDYSAIDKTELLFGIPFTGSGYKDSTDANEARFTLPVGMEFTNGSLLVIDRGSNSGVRMIKMEGGAYKETLTLVDKKSEKINSSSISGLSKDNDGNAYLSQVFYGASAAGKCMVLKLPKEMFDFSKYPDVESRNSLIENYICEGDFSGFALASVPDIYSTEHLNGYLYMPDYSNNVIWRVGADKKVELFAGTLGQSGYLNYDIEVKAKDAKFARAYQITGLNGRLYVYDGGVKAVYEIDPGKDEPTVKLIAGCMTLGQSDGVGTSACFNSVNGISGYYDNKVLLADSNAQTIRMLDVATHEVTTLAGKAYDKDWIDADFKSARFNRPLSIECSSELKACFVGDEQALRVMK